MIRVYAESAHPGPALDIHRKMLHAEVSPDMHTYPFLIKACAKLMSLRDGEMVHGKVVRLGMERLVFVQNALVHFYSSCGLFERAYNVFEGITERTLVTWNSIINGFAANGRANEVLTLFREMSMEDEGARRVDPDAFTMVGLLTACVELGALALGKRVHVYLVKAGLNRNSHVGNALIDLYAKCGLFDEAYKVFDEMGRYRNVVSWNSLIVGLALNGYGKQALDLFAQMERKNLVPTDITMIGVLYACSHCGLVDDGFMYFDQMKSKYNITPRIEHFGCIVDLLGRCGQVYEAYNYILKMPIEPSAVVWRTLLGACTMHKELDLGLTVWARLVDLDPGHSGDYVLLSNLYAAVGQWSQVHKLRRNMLSGGVRKNPGRSIVEIGNSVHEFVMGDRSHADTDDIYNMLDEISKRLRREGYKAATGTVLADIEEEEKETALNYHSERLAIAFGLLRSAKGATIRVVKNLRVCVDCHDAIKIISRVYAQDIVVRDRSRFHHFRDGSCSCNDYW